jgi:soluble lytic murein transglycosylase
MMHEKPRNQAVAVAALLGTIVGLGLGSPAFASALRAYLPAVTRMPAVVELQPVHALPRTELLMVLGQVQAHLEADEPWSAWLLLRPHLDGEAMTAGSSMLAARAAAGWGGWAEVRELLRGQAWMDRGAPAEAWALLARAEEEGGHWQRAAAAYERHAEHATGGAGAASRVRAARMFERGGDPARAATAYAAAAEALPALADWMRALEAERRLEAGDAGALGVASRAPRGSGPARLRALRTESSARLAAGDTATALRRLGEESRVLAGMGMGDEAAALAIEQAALLQRVGREAEARELLRATAAEPSWPGARRAEAARRLGEVAEPRTLAEELARAAAFEAAARPGQAARALRGALAAGLPDEPAVRLRLGRLLFEERDFRPARAVLTDVAPLLGDRAQRAEAEMLAARARYRAGERQPAVAELRRVAEQYAGTPAAGTAWFLLGDDAANLQQALGHYRRAAAVATSPDAQEALYRVGDRSLRAKDPAGAVRAWEDYVARYPRGERSAEVAYRTAEIHRRAGRRGPANAMYTAAMLADPLSYHALRAGERIGADPLASIFSEPRPWVGLAADPVDARTALERLDLLQAAGLDEVWREEHDAAVRRLESRPAALLAFAEGLADRERPVEAIRLGRRLLQMRGGEWDPRLLRVVFPFPYREQLTREARRSGVEPALFAGLVRQESTFRPDVRSRVGATGLSQIMPATGRWLATGMRIEGYHDGLLRVPEVNLRMGARYLADQLRRYDGHADLALAAYNAGPGRADRWRRELNHGADTDAFREAIPFDETRHYVQVVLRNEVVYRRLYGE